MAGPGNDPKKKASAAANKSLSASHAKAAALLEKSVAGAASASPPPRAPEPAAKSSSTTSPGRTFQPPMLCPNELCQIEQLEAAPDGFVCPHCGKEVSDLYIQDYDKYPTVVFCLIGLTGHGKTCFLSGLLYEMKRVNEVWPDFRAEPLNVRALDVLRDSVEGLDQKLLPGSTAAGFAEPTVIRFTGIPGIGRVQVLFIDNGGETFRDRLRVKEFAGYVKRAPSVVWLLGLGRESSELDLIEMLMEYRSGLYRLGGNAKSQSLIVAVTKGDELPDRARAPESVRKILGETLPPSTGYGIGFLEELSRDVRAWLRQPGRHPQFVNQSEEHFQSVNYCLTSALGAPPKIVGENAQLSAPPTPRGIFLPLYLSLRAQLPSVTVSDPSGTQSYFSLSEAVERAPQGATLTLGAGVHELKSPLIVRKSLTLKGAGRDLTWVTSSSGNYVMAVEGSAKQFTLCDMSLEYTGQENSRTVIIAGADARVSNCRFVGARRIGRDTANGIGLHLFQCPSAVVENCIALRNDMYGIAADNSRVDIRQTVCFDNGQAGIAYFRGAKGECFDNDCTHNEIAGIALLTSCRPVLRENRCFQNGEDGIRVDGKAFPELIGNHAALNGRHGICIRSDSSAVVLRNRCWQNAAGGIDLHGRAGAVEKVKLEGNVCDDNGGSGLQMAENSIAAGSKNAFRRNRKTGVVITGDAWGNFRKNSAEQNRQAGFEFAERSRCSSEENLSVLNTGHGYLLADNVRFDFGRNVSERNGGSGICVSGQAGGSLSNNTLKSNEQFGLEIAQSCTSAVAHDNEMDGNRLGNLHDQRVVEAPPLELVAKKSPKPKPRLFPWL